VTNVSHFLSFVLLIAFIYAAITFIKLFIEKKELVYVFYSLASAALIVTTLINLSVNYLIKFNISQESISIWGSVVSISFVLCGLMVLIRNSKPEFARFPEVFVGLPILVIISFPFISSTIILKYWLLGIYEACALLVALMMHSVLSKRNAAHLIVLSGIGLFILAYLFYWLPWEMFNLKNLLWQAVMIIGVIVIIQGYTRIETTVREENLESY